MLAGKQADSFLPHHRASLAVRKTSIFSGTISKTGSQVLLGKEESWSVSWPRSYLSQVAEPFSPGLSYATPHALFHSPALIKNRPPPRPLFIPCSILLRIITISDLAARFPLPALHHLPHETLGAIFIFCYHHGFPLTAIPALPSAQQPQIALVRFDLGPPLHSTTCAGMARDLEMGTSQPLTFLFL